VSDPTLHSGLDRFLRPVVRARYVLLIAWGGFWCWREYTATTDWRLFTAGGALLFGDHKRVYLLPHLYFLGTRPGGLHLYANYRTFQTGPLTLALAAGLRFIGPNRGAVANVVLMLALGIALVLIVESSASSVASRHMGAGWLINLTVLLGGLVLIPAWAKLAGSYGHTDDALALFGVAAAVWCVANGSPWLCGVAIAFAIISKPWAITFLPLALAFKRRDACRALLAASASTAAVVLPFVVADRATLRVGAFPYRIAANSTLILFHLKVGSVSPSWVRPMELVGGLVFASVAALRGRWYAIPVVAVAARVAIDPETYGYYATGVVAAAMIWDLYSWRRPLPIATLASFVLLLDAPALAGPAVQAIARLAVGVIAILIVGWPTHHRRVDSARSVGEETLVPALELPATRAEQSVG